MTISKMKVSLWFLIDGLVLYMSEDSVRKGAVDSRGDI